MHSKVRALIATVAVILPSLLLYAPFLSNPLVFDDQYFFLPGNPESYLSAGFQATPRWIPYYSHALTKVLLGDRIEWQRIGNILIHAGSGYVLYKFTLELLTDLDKKKSEKNVHTFAALASAAIFTLHPSAVFATAYLIQRSTLSATFFCLLCWMSFWRGLSGPSANLWMSSLFYLLAILSKEHSVMAPAVCGALLLLYQRSNPKKTVSYRTLSTIFFVFGAIALFATYKVKYVLGAAYEPLAGNILELTAGSPPTESAHLRSVVTQAGLFFKYLLLWIIPNGSWMSVDMRETFFHPPLTPLDTTLLIAFFAYPIATIILIFKGHLSGLIGVALLAPWLLFGTELSSVRIQEIFVLYRSYLWMAPATLALGVALTTLSQRIMILFTLLVCSALFVISTNILSSFSEPIFLWDDAARLVEEKKLKSGAFPAGAERIYHNRGIAMHTRGILKNAVDDYTTAISIRPTIPYPYSDRGAALLELNRPKEALSDFEHAMTLDETLLRPYIGRARALEKMGETRAAETANKKACEKGSIQNCSKKK